MKRCVLLLAALVAFGLGPPAAPPGGDDAAAVAAVLDALHEAASRADGAEYFGLFAPEAVFLGTDATERWPIDEFKRYATARFQTGRGWTYRASERHVSLSDDGATAWFDERLHNETYGECRGTGVLVKRAGAWTIAQYNLTIPIPNEIALDVVRMIRMTRDLGSDP